MMNSVAALSLLLFISTTGLWIRSYRVADWLITAKRPSVSRGQQVIFKSHRIVSSRGGLLFEWHHEKSARSSSRLEDVSVDEWIEDNPASYPLYEFDSADAQYVHRIDFVGFYGTIAKIPVSGDPSSFAETYSLTVPLSFLSICFALLPIFRLRSRLRRRNRGHCPRCGYDLRATPTLCPECGYNAAKTNEA